MRALAQACQSSSSKSVLPHSRNGQAIREWLMSKERPHFSLQNLHITRLNELFALLPTRSVKYPILNLQSTLPSNGRPISLQYYFGLFPDIYDNAPAKTDGGTAWHAPQSFHRRLRHSGRVIMSLKSPPFVGMNFIKKGIYLKAKGALHSQGTGTPILHTERKMVAYQWFPIRTELLNEKCVTAFYPNKYDGRINKFDCLPSPSERLLSYSFMPRRWRIRDFAIFSQDTHKIHYDPDHARLEGYPDLVVQTSLQLAIMLDTMHAYMPKGSMCNAIEYRVINPLFCNNEILVFRHWYPKKNSTTRPPLCLDDLEADPSLSIDTNSKEKQETSQELKAESDMGQNSKDSTLPRRSGIEARVLLWTENENGVVGTVLFATLIKESHASWELDPDTGYILPVGSIWPLDQKRIGIAVQSSMKDLVQNLDKSIAEPETFDSLGRPISRRLSQPLRAWPSRHPWQQDDDIATLESERDARKQYATRLEESRNLLGQIIKGDDDNSE